MVYPISHRRHCDSSISVVYFNFLPQVRPFPQICPGFDIVFLRVSKCDTSLSASHMLNGIEPKIPKQKKLLGLKRSKLLYSKIYVSCKPDFIANNKVETDLEKLDQDCKYKLFLPLL